MAGSVLAVAAARDARPVAHLGSPRADAPHPAYGGPPGLAHLVQAAHDNDLAVFVDVVYNHLGAGSEAAEAFGPYTTSDRETVWGGAMNFAACGVREWAIQNAEMWVRDYRVDGLRLDAVHAISDDSEEHVMAELARRVKGIDPAVVIISEMEIGDLRPIEEWGHDAQWEDSLHHATHVLVTGEQEGYYSAYGAIHDVARELQRAEGRHFVSARRTTTRSATGPWVTVCAAGTFGWPPSVRSFPAGRRCSFRARSTTRLTRSSTSPITSIRRSRG